MSPTTPHYGPPDASLAPRYTGPRTFARLPHVELPEPGIDAAVLGVPFDTATSFRPGARFGPEAIRSASTLLRPYNPALRVDVFESLSVVDGGDLAVTPGNARRTAEQIDAGLRPVLEAGIVPLVLGGDHSIVLGELRAQAAVHGPVGLVLIDAHADTWDQYYGERYFHGTPFRRAVEEGILDPTRSLLAGMRGPLYGAGDATQPLQLGFEVIGCDELRRLAATPERYRERVLARAGDGPLFMSFDIDSLDPAFAPGTGTPEVAGLTPAEALALLRSLAGIRFTGFDLVEVSPPYDTAGQVTALNAAAIAFEMLSLLAVAHG
ncbi:MAG TPA: agmatinase [Solirubrobacteraceae bacterium]|nr:agmatinase [Solirubrobacteraceae bacterium]